MGEYISKIPGIKKRGLKRVILVVMDFVLISICYFLAIIFRYYMAGQEVSYRNYECYKRNESFRDYYINSLSMDNETVSKHLEIGGT